MRRPGALPAESESVCMSPTEFTDPDAPLPTDSTESPAAPTRRTFIATTTAVGGVVVTGGLIAGSTFVDAEEAAADEAAPTTVSL